MPKLIIMVLRLVCFSVGAFMSASLYNAIMTQKVAMTIIIVIAMTLAGLLSGIYDPEKKYLPKKRVKNPPMSDTLIVSLTPDQKRLLCFAFVALINNADRRSSDVIAELAYKLGVGKELGDLLNDFIKKYPQDGKY
jgi:uncharacterized protein YneF (UPF0154 family)